VLAEEAVVAAKAPYLNVPFFLAVLSFTLLHGIGW
jgi:hypothetical protein